MKNFKLWKQSKNDLKNQNINSRILHLGLLRKSCSIGAASLAIAYFWVNCANSYAAISDTPEKAVVMKVEGQRITFRLGRSGSAQLVQAGQTTLTRFREILEVPGNKKSQAGLILQNAKGQLVNNTNNKTFFWAGPKDTPTEYSLSCTVSVGSGTVGFANGPCNKGIVVRPYRNRSAKVPSSNQFQFAQNLKSILKAQATTEEVYYCNTVSDSGRGWAVSSSQSSLDDSCQQATEKCSQLSSGQECSVASLGEWDINDPELVISMQCENYRPITRKGNGQAINGDLLPIMIKMGEVMNTPACTFHVYNPEDMIVAPANSNEPTLIHTYDSEDGYLAVDVLVGNARIISAQQPQGLTVNKGYGYSQKDNNQKALDCPKVFKSSSTQGFLESANWSPSGESGVDRSVDSQLKQYRTDFCQTGGKPNNNVLDNLPDIRINIPWPGRRNPDRNPDRPTNERNQRLP